MKYAKYLLIIVAVYFGLKFRNDYFNAGKEIRIIENANKDEVRKKSNKYELISENNNFKHDSACLIQDLKYLKQKHDIVVQHLNGDLDDQTFVSKMIKFEMDQLADSIALDNLLYESELKNIFPVAQIPTFLKEKEKSSLRNYKLMFVLSGLMTLIFLMIDKSRRIKAISDLKTKQREARAILPSQQSEARQQAETEARSFHKEHADKDTGNLKIVTQKTSEEGPDKYWFVTKEWKNPATGKSEYIVQDAEGNHESLTQGQLAGDPEEISENEFADLSMNEFNLAQQTKQAQEDNTMIRDGQRLKRLPNGDGIGNKTEVFEDENGKYVEVPNEEVAAWEQAKQQTKDPNIVTRQYGKTKITGVKDGNNIAISDPMTLDQANRLKEEVEKTTGGKSTVKAEKIPNEDSTVAKCYQVFIVTNSILPFI